MARFSTLLEQWVRGEDLTLHASAAETSTINGAVQNSEEASSLDLFLDVTAVSGSSPTLDVKIQTRDGASDSWVDVTPAFTQATGVTSERKRITGLGKQIRFVAAIGGSSPSFTFSLTGVSK